MNNKKLEKEVNEKILKGVDKNWAKPLKGCINELDKEYLKNLLNDKYFPTVTNLFNPFKTLKKEMVKYVLFGQEPFPREESASGYAFIDSKVEEIFIDDNLSLTREINKATSLRNFIKMLLVSMGIVSPDKTNKKDLENKKRKNLINSINELRENFEANGVLLLNASLVYENKKNRKEHLINWKPFFECLIKNIDGDIKFILLGKNAHEIAELIKTNNNIYKFEHPYKSTFIKNTKIHEAFAPMKLLTKNVE